MKYFEFTWGSIVWKSKLVFVKATVGLETNAARKHNFVSTASAPSYRSRCRSTGAMDHQLLIITSQSVYITWGAYYFQYSWHLFRVHQHYMNLFSSVSRRSAFLAWPTFYKGKTFTGPDHSQFLLLRWFAYFAFETKLFFRMPKNPELDLPKRHRSTYSNHIRLNSFVDSSEI